LIAILVAHEEGGGSTDFDIDCLSSTAPLVGGPYSLTVTTEGQGSVTLDPPGGSYAAGTMVQLTANGVGDWMFCGWSGDLSGVVNLQYITMTSNKSVTATFIEVLAGPDSTINDVRAYDPNNTSAEGRPSDLPYGMMEVEIGVLNPGDTGVVTVNLPSAAPADYDWYKYTVADGWINFMRDEISGGTGDGAVINGDEVTLYITDNGPYDTDPTPGVIKDPSGLGSTAASPPPSGGSSGGGGGGGCFIATASFGSPPLALMGLLLAAMAGCVVVLVRRITARGRMV